MNGRVIKKEMGDKLKKHRMGVTLVEVLIATAVTSVAATGALSYEYHAAKQRESARAFTRAVSTGYFLLEDWKANGGSTQYSDCVAGAHNPTKLKINGTTFVYDKPSRHYEITIDKIPLRITLTRSYPVLDLRLLLLEATVQWPLNLKEFSNKNPVKSVVLKTYARIDQEGG